MGITRWGRTSGRDYQDPINTTGRDGFIGMKLDTERRRRVELWIKTSPWRVRRKYLRRRAVVGGTG